MEEKTIWQRVAGLVGARGDRGLRELRTHTRRCPAGHPMAVDWSDCPYCRAQRTTVTEAGRMEPAPAGVTSGPPGEPAAAAPTLVRGREVSARPSGAVVFSVLYDPDTGRYRIADESGGGTLLNGKPIDSKGSELADQAQIRAGNALFILKRVRAPASGAESPVMQEQPIATHAGEAPRVEATGKKPT